MVLSEHARAGFFAGAARAGAGVRRIAVAAGPAGIRGLAEPAVAGVVAAGVAILGGGAVSAIFLASGFEIAAVIGFAAISVVTVIVPIALRQRPIAVIEQQ